MAWYWIVLIIIAGIVLITSIANRIGNISAQEKYDEFIADISTWQVGDKLKMTSYYAQQLKNKGLKYATLVKWDDKEVMVDMGDGFTTLLKHSDILENHDDFWRMKYASMNKFMREINKLTEYKPKNEKGEEIESKMDIKIDDSGNLFINDMMLEGMSEIHLNIFLKYAVEEGNNKLASRIREELKKHR